MKKLMLAMAMAALAYSGMALAQRGGAPPALTDSGPGVPLVKSFLDAYNKQDAATVTKMVAPEIVFMDDDGHTIKGMDFVGGMLQRRMTAAVAEKITAGAITSGGTADVVWAGFPYTFARGDVSRKGLMTMVFKKAGADWQVVHFQFAIDQVPANSLDRR